MTEFRGKVAVVTGAASGIGRAIAERCAREGMRVVLADVEEDALSEATACLRGAGAEVIGVRTDVSNPGDVQALAQSTISKFGAVHLLFNNAGVIAGTTVWDSALADWQWVMGVNLWGVIHATRIFVPLMVAQNTEGHIVNTASIVGLLPYFESAPYLVTKHAVVALSEHLFFSLARQSPQVKVSVLCPGPVESRILASERNRPAELTAPKVQEGAATEKATEDLQARMPPHEVADRVFEAIREDRFCILTHPDFDSAVLKRTENLIGLKSSKLRPFSLRRRFFGILKKLTGQRKRSPK